MLVKCIFLLKDRRTHTTCAVIGCLRQNSNFHRFPKDEKRRKVWLSATGQKCVNFNTARICGDHFQPSDYLNILKAQLLNDPSLLKRLKPTAVPSMKITNETMSVAIEKINQKRTVNEIYGEIELISSNKMEPTHVETLLKMKSVMENLRYCNNPEIITKKPFQKGIIVSIQSTLSLFKELQYIGFEYVLTAKLNQD